MRRAHARLCIAGHHAKALTAAKSKTEGGLWIQKRDIAKRYCEGLGGEKCDGQDTRFERQLDRITGRTRYVTRRESHPTPAGAGRSPVRWGRCGR